MEHIHSIIIIKKSDKYLNYYDEKWGIYLFPNIIRTYHHYFYEVDTEVDGEYFSLDELLENPNIKKYNEDIIRYIDSYYSASSNSNKC